MPEKREKDSDKMIKKLENLENKLDKVEKESKLSGEDQLFFGLIIALVILFLTLPTDDISNLFKSLNSVAAEYSATVIKYVGFAFFVVASVTRYYAALKESPASEKFRFYSLEALIGGFDLIITVFLLNTISFLSSIILSVQIFPSIQTATSVIALVFTALTVILTGVLRLEIKILDLYKTNGIVPQDSRPLITLMFLLISMSLDVGFLSEILLMFGFSQDFSPERFAIVGLIGFFIFAYGLIIKRRRKVIRPS